jgi:hypothetical protein
VELARRGRLARQESLLGPCQGQRVAAQGSDEDEDCLPPLHVKQAQYNGLVKLSQALQEKQDLVEAIKVAYPEKTERQRWKLARDFTSGLQTKLAKARKLAARQKQAMGMMGQTAMPGAGGASAGGGGNMGAAGGVLSGMMGGGAGGGAGLAPATGMSDGGMGQAGGGIGGAGMQTAPSYSTNEAVGGGGMSAGY